MVWGILEVNILWFLILFCKTPFFSITTFFNIKIDLPMTLCISSEEVYATSCLEEKLQFVVLAAGYYMLSLVILELLLLLLFVMTYYCHSCDFWVDSIVSFWIHPLTNMTFLLLLAIINSKMVWEGILSLNICSLLLLI